MLVRPEEADGHEEHAASVVRGLRVDQLTPGIGDAVDRACGLIEESTLDLREPDVRVVLHEGAECEEGLRGVLHVARIGCVALRRCVEGTSSAGDLLDEISLEIDGHVELLLKPGQ